MKLPNKVSGIGCQVSESDGNLTTFENLDVFKRAYRISLEIHKQSKKFPKDEQYSLADQIRRASKSVCANIVEGCAKQFHSKPEFKRFILIAIGSSDEVRMWSRYCYDLEYIDQQTWQHWRDEYQRISKMLHGLYKAQNSDTRHLKSVTPL